MRHASPLTIAALCATATVASGQDDERLGNRKMIAPEQQVISIEDATLNADVWGTRGDTIIALPGLGADTAWYRLLGPGVAAAGYRFVALNPRGVRGSTGSLQDLTLEKLAQDVANTIDSLGVEKAHLVGWAFGNRVARAVSTNHPEVVATVTLLASGGRVPPSESAADAMNILFTSTDLPPDERVALMKVAYFSPMSDVPSILASIPSGLWPDATAAQFAAARSAPLDSWWAGGTAPMLVVQGLDDEAAVPENGHILSDEFSDRVTLVELRDAGHMLLVEQPNSVAESIVKFLGSHPIAEASLIGE